MAWPYGRPDVPSSLFFTMTAFLPAYLPVRRITTLLGCTQKSYRVGHSNSTFSFQ